MLFPSQGMRPREQSVWLQLASLRHMEQLLLSFPREAPISLHCVRCQRRHVMRTQGWLGTEEMIETVLAVFPLEAVRAEGSIRTTAGWSCIEEKKAGSGAGPPTSGPPFQTG
eukprot:Polyplicarium_translucidae@DN3153_c0_g1_i9.p2